MRSRRSSTSLVLTLAGALAACVPQTAPITAASSSDATPVARDAYVGMASASDLFEIQSSQLAQQRAQSSAVRDFAQMMIADHTETTRQLAAAAQSVGIGPLAPALLPMQARMMDQLRAAGSGAAFDRLYLDQQVQAHQTALSLHGNYSDNGDTPQLRTLAAAAVPIVQRHLGRVRQLAASGGG
jgi:putative membrane protein